MVNGMRIKSFALLVMFSLILTAVPITTNAVAALQGSIDGYDASAMYIWEDDDLETQWGIERIFDGDYDGYVPTGNVDVAILDTGIDLDHPDLVANIVWGYSCVDDWTVDDINGHGSHCAGVIGADYNGFGVVGVYSNVDLYGIRVLNNGGVGTWEDITEGVYVACRGPDGIEGTDDDADVISMSLGGGGDDPLLHEAITHAYNMGIVVVASAGNGGDGDPLTEEISYPASYPEVIAVGATNSDDSVTSFSNTGSYIEVVAPGYRVYSTWKFGKYRSMSGTSMSCPHVAGLVAMIIALHGKMPVGDFKDKGMNTIRGFLHHTSLDMGVEGWDPAYGYGLIQAGQLI